MSARATLVLAFALLPPGCATPTGNNGDLDAAVPFDGAFLGRCASDDYVMIPAADCLATACLGTEAFAICEGASYSQCICAPPGGGFTFVEAGAQDVRVDAVPDAGRLDGGGSHS
jgi:hypothetical protein